MFRFLFLIIFLLAQSAFAHPFYVSVGAGILGSMGDNSFHFDAGNTTSKVSYIDHTGQNVLMQTERFNGLLSASIGCISESSGVGVSLAYQYMPLTMGQVASDATTILGKTPIGENSLQNGGWTLMAMLEYHAPIDYIDRTGLYLALGAGAYRYLGSGSFAFEGNAAIGGSAINVHYDLAGEINNYNDWAPVVQGKIGFDCLLEKSLLMSFDAGLLITGPINQISGGTSSISLNYGTVEQGAFDLGSATVTVPPLLIASLEARLSWLFG